MLKLGILSGAVKSRADIVSLSNLFKLASNTGFLQLASDTGVLKLNSI